MGVQETAGRRETPPCWGERKPRRGISPAKGKLMLGVGRVAWSPASREKKRRRKGGAGNRQPTKREGGGAECKAGRSIGGSAGACLGSWRMLKTGENEQWRNRAGQVKNCGKQEGREAERQEKGRVGERYCGRLTHHLIAAWRWRRGKKGG